MPGRFDRHFWHPLRPMVQLLPRWTRLIGVVLALLVAGALHAADAHAGCGGVQHVAPTKRIVPNRAPIVIGDSVLLGAMPDVAARGFEVNARGCRSWGEGHRLVWGLKHSGRLPHLVVMQLGTNWSITVAQIRRTLKVIGPRRVLAILTPREVGGYGGSDAQAVRAAGRRYPKQVVVLDWVKASRGHSSWFQPDGIHLTYPGAHALALFLRAARPYASAEAMADKPVPLR